MKKTIIASGQGFWGDWLEAPIRQIEGGPIDYLVLDYLAEVTMSILAKQKAANPSFGYAKDFPVLIEKVLPQLIDKKIKVISNAGGLNPEACAEAIVKAAHAKNLKIKIAIVKGDDLSTLLLSTLLKASLSESLNPSTENFENLETGRPVSEIKGLIKSANAYLGCESIVEALSRGAEIIVCGRVADPSMVLAPMRYEFGWEENDWDKLASGILAGHIIECGAQASGGNFSGDWANVPDLANIGFPIVEAYENGDFVITKHPKTGGLVSQATVKEQMVYEIGDPQNYYTPDVIADFASAQLSDDGANRVKITSVKGKPKPEKYKVSISYFYGYRTASTLVYSWPSAYKKAKAAEQILKNRIKDLGLQFDKINAEVIGVNACHGQLTDFDNPELAEVMLRFAVQGKNEKDVKRFTREMAPLVLSGPPFATSYAGGKGEVSEVYAYWPSLVARTKIKTEIKYYN